MSNITIFDPSRVIAVQGSGPNRVKIGSPTCWLPSRRLPNRLLMRVPSRCPSPESEPRREESCDGARLRTPPLLLALLGRTPPVAAAATPPAAEASRDVATGRAETGRDGADRTRFSREVADGDASSAFENEHGWVMLPVPTLPGRLPATTTRRSMQWVETHP